MEHKRISTYHGFQGGFLDNKKQLLFLVTLCYEGWIFLY